MAVVASSLHKPFDLTLRQVLTLVSRPSCSMGKLIDERRAGKRAVIDILTLAEVRWAITEQGKTAVFSGCDLAHTQSAATSYLV
jgi:hypothetical protein